MTEFQFRFLDSLMKCMSEFPIKGDILLTDYAWIWNSKREDGEILGVVIAGVFDFNLPVYILAHAD